MPTTAYIITCDGEFDQVCETPSAAIETARDLEVMGGRVKIITCLWDKQDDVIEGLTS